VLNFLDPYIERITPHVITAREAATSYAERIIAQLEAIRDAVETEDFAERRVGLENPQTRGMTEIERDQNWIVELVTLDAAGTVTIRENGRTRYVKTFATPDSAGGNNLVLRGGATVEFLASAGNLFVQVKVNQPRPARHLSAVFHGSDVTINGHGAPFSNAGRHSPGDMTVRPIGDAPTGGSQGV
jgi:hypothetical protein